MHSPLPPLVGPHGEDAARIEYTRRSRRILYGEHYQDVLDRMALQLHDVRREAWGYPDMASNPFKAVWSALSTLYDRTPTVTLRTETADESAGYIADLADAEGYWQLMARGQRDCLALRELLMRVTVTIDDEGEPHPVYEPVYPDMVVALDDPANPGVPVELFHAREREVEGEDGRPKCEWLWDHLSIRDPAAPVYRVLRTGKSEEPADVSALFGVGGWPDEWRDADGRPVLPYVLFHAAQTPYIWDPYQTRELIEGTLNVAVLRSFVAHVARNSAWRQRYSIDVVPAGAGFADEDHDGRGRMSIVADPATIIRFIATDRDGANPQVGTFDVPVVPEELWQYIEGYERKLISEAGINPADTMAMKGDPRSGYALAVSRDSQREAQRRYEPQFRRGDEAVLGITAMQINRLLGTSYPETGYRVTYHGIPKSAAERAALREHLIALLEVGLLDPVSAYQQLHPGLTDAQAMEQLKRIQVTRRELEAADAADTIEEVSNERDV